MLGRLAADQAVTRRLFVGVDRANCHYATFGLEARLAIRFAAPWRPHEASALFEVRDHLGQRRHLESVLAQIFLRSGEQRLLESSKLVLQPAADSPDRNGATLAGKPVDQLHLA